MRIEKLVSNLKVSDFSMEREVSYSEKRLKTFLIWEFVASKTSVGIQCSHLGLPWGPFGSFGVPLGSLWPSLGSLGDALGCLVASSRFC